MTLFSLSNRHYTSWSKSYLTLGEYNVEDILPLIGRGSSKITLFGYNQEPYQVKISSTRLQTFQKNLRCVSCHVIGNIFLLQASKTVLNKVNRTNCFIEECAWCYYASYNQRPLESPHLNLFYRSENNSLSLMTQDHIHPWSKGGTNDLSNLQTMCRNCNSRKGDNLLS